MTRLAKTFLLLLCLLGPVSGMAYSAIALSPVSHDSVAWAYNYGAQKEADRIALGRCQAAVKGLKLKPAEKCRIALRGKGPGHGALTCGDTGCGFHTGAPTAQEAVDAAFQQCAKTSANCRSDDITWWVDVAGFRSSRAATTAPAPSGDCRPRTATLTCRSTCTNGSCEVRYENGCRMRVQVQPRLDPFSNQWVYPSPSC